MPRSARRIERVTATVQRRLPDLTVVLENVHDPHNVSAVLRTCDAVGVLQAELLYTIEKFPRIGKKSSSSANKWVLYRKHTSVAECYAQLRSEGFTLYATRLDPRARLLYDLDLTRKTAFVLGNEHRGVSDDAAAQADGLVIIPMRGMIESLNVSVAAGVCLYEALRQRLARGLCASPALPPAVLASMLEAWLQK
jgi:tRNA (guanosine-2'-O-)-methyltransferase